ncbi:hypothetical protein [Aquirhabdus sp.]|uniref:hypothetical protein n=1 Tax=Aquirhabdus sp. TaxID=2824160 RepID=UPI00396CBACA
MMKPVWLIMLSCVSSAAWAGRPFFTDDASLTDPHSCQLETWYQGTKESDMLSVMPACNPTGNFEITAGYTQLSHQGGNGEEHGYVLQGKTVLRSMEIDHQYGIALAFGVARSDHRQNGGEYAYVPISYASPRQAWNSNVDIGFIREEASGKNRLTWGAGTSYNINSRLMVFGELFGHLAINPKLHTGISISVIPDLVQMDLTYGKDLELNKDANSYTVGFSFQLPKPSK